MPPRDEARGVGTVRINRRELLRLACVYGEPLEFFLFSE
jgi:hypothetical protein